MAVARAARGKPHVAKTRRLIPLFAKLAAGKARRRKLRDQHCRYEARLDTENRRIREAALNQYQPEIDRIREREAPKPPPDIIDFELHRAFHARHRGITEADERLEEIGYERNQARAWKRIGEQYRETPVDS
jgi:hypothetical protein